MLGVQQLAPLVTPDDSQSVGIVRQSAQRQ